MSGGRQHAHPRTNPTWRGRASSGDGGPRQGRRGADLDVVSVAAVSDVRHGLVALGDSITRGGRRADARRPPAVVGAVARRGARAAAHQPRRRRRRSPPASSRDQLPRLRGPYDLGDAATSAPTTRARSAFDPAGVRRRGRHVAGGAARRARAHARADGPARPRPPAGGREGRRRQRRSSAATPPRTARSSASSTTCAARGSCCPTPCTRPRPGWSRSPTARRARCGGAAAALELAEDPRRPPRPGRYGAWYAKQRLRERRRRLLQRWQYRQRP